MTATIYELWNDRRGDSNKSDDVIIRIALLCFEATALALGFNRPFIDSLLLTCSVFFLTFDYAIAYILIKNGTIEPPRGVKYHWFIYTGKSGYVDNIPLWKNMNPWLKFGLRLTVFAVALTIFIL